MAKKPEPKKLQWKGKTEEDRQDAMLIYTTLANIRARFGQTMIPVEISVLDLVMAERIVSESEEEEPQG
jgi:hypothetical protein